MMPEGNEVVDGQLRIVKKASVRRHWRPGVLNAARIGQAPYR